jgi:hypothetical protein
MADLTAVERKTLDITLDEDTLDYLQHDMQDGWDSRTKVRVTARGKQYVIKDRKLYKRADAKLPSDRPVLAITERLHIVTQTHKAAHCGVDTLRKLVNKLYWQDIGTLAKSVRGTKFSVRR